MLACNLPGSIPFLQKRIFLSCVKNRLNESELKAQIRDEVNRTDIFSDVLKPGVDAFFIDAESNFRCV